MIDEGNVRCLEKTSAILACLCNNHKIHVQVYLKIIIKYYETVICKPQLSKFQGK